jgi:hypothetical protein
MATRVINELGLDHGSFPDLTDSATRHKLSPAAIAAFFKITELWDLNNDEAMSLLGGVSHGRYYALKRTRKGLLTQDELTRVSLLIGIFKSLNILFNRKLANQWISRPNSNPLFRNEPPHMLMTLGGVPGMLTVRRLLDSRRGGR